MSTIDYKANWEDLKAALKQDAEIWGEMFKEAEAKHKLCIDLSDRQKLEQAIIMFSLYQSSAESYLALMTAIESEGDDGGQETTES